MQRRRSQRQQSQQAMMPGLQYMPQMVMPQMQMMPTMRQMQPMQTQQMQPMQQTQSQFPPEPTGNKRRVREDDDGDDSGDSSEEEERMNTKRWLENTFLSKSFKHWGGEYRPITRSLKNRLLHLVLSSSSGSEEVDMNLICEQDSRGIDKLFFIFFHIKPDQKVANSGHVGSPLRDLFKLLKTCRARVAKNHGGNASMMGLDADWSNIDMVARNLGWQDDWFIVKKTRGMKVTAEPCEQNQMAICDGVAHEPAVAQQPPLQRQQEVRPPPCHIIVDAASRRSKLARVDGAWAWCSDADESVALVLRNDRWVLQYLGYVVDLVKFMEKARWQNLPNARMQQHSQRMAEAVQPPGLTTVPVQNFPIARGGLPSQMRAAAFTAPQPVRQQPQGAANGDLSGGASMDEDESDEEMPNPEASQSARPARQQLHDPSHPMMVARPKRSPAHQRRAPAEPLQAPAQPLQAPAHQPLQAPAQPIHDRAEQEPLQSLAGSSHDAMEAETQAVVAE